MRVLNCVFLVNIKQTTLAILLVSFFTFGSTCFAQEEWRAGEIRLKHEYQHFTLPKAEDYIEYTEVKINEEFCTEEEKNEVVEFKKMINKDAIKDFLTEKIAPEIEQEVQNVRIFRNELGEIEFDGYGQRGKLLHLDISAEIIAKAIEENISTVTLYIETEEPVVTVEDEDLKSRGIHELISVGRSNFYPSSKSRIQNIMAGASKFNGYIISPGEVFSFNTQLGKIDKSTGYAPEYVIIGPKLEKEYGGGLCQVSSTAYRGVMTAGLEIIERHNHSFAVNHYLPYGSDATIYQGVKDFRWKNDSTADILIQTRRGGKKNSELFFHYYGTKPGRNVSILGPNFENYKTPPKNKKTYDTAIPAGTEKRVSTRVAGFDAVFNRKVFEGNTEKINDRFLSPYEARGNWTIIGGEDPSKAAPSSSEISRNNT